MSKEKTLIVEGWRFLPHSYAVVNQWQLLALCRRPGLFVKVIDAPLYHPKWTPEEGLFEPDQERELRLLQLAQPREPADATLRIFARYDFSPSNSRRTAVFATCEFQMIPRRTLVDPAVHEQFARGRAPDAVEAVTPSHWSAEGFYRAGFPPDRVHIIPHGVDIKTFHPMPQLRREIRRDMGIGEDEFVFLSIGAMTANKGMDLLLRAFAEVIRKFPQSRLILKGVDPLYDSQTLLKRAMELVPVDAQERIVSRISYFGQSFSFREMAMLYQSADAYVAPYRAEGFSIPVLEAAACGVAVICTCGGPTDDFVTDSFARRIESRKLLTNVRGEDQWMLEPNLDHLISLMISAVENDVWRQTAVIAGPAHVRARYTWENVADLLTAKLLN